MGNSTTRCKRRMRYGKVRDSLPYIFAAVAFLSVLYLLGGQAQFLEFIEEQVMGHRVVWFVDARSAR